MGNFFDPRNQQTTGGQIGQALGGLFGLGSLGGLLGGALDPAGTTGSQEDYLNQVFGTSNQTVIRDRLCALEVPQCRSIPLTFPLSAYGIDACQAIGACGGFSTKRPAGQAGTVSGGFAPGPGGQLQVNTAGGFQFGLGGGNTLGFPAGFFPTTTGQAGSLPGVPAEIQPGFNPQFNFAPAAPLIGAVTSGAKFLLAEAASALAFAGLGAIFGSSGSDAPGKNLAQQAAANSPWGNFPKGAIGKWRDCRWKGKFPRYAYETWRYFTCSKLALQRESDAFFNKGKLPPVSSSFYPEFFKDQERKNRALWKKHCACGGGGGGSRRRCCPTTRNIRYTCNTC